MDMVLVRSTYATQDDAKQAARHLIQNRLAACVHVQPVWSTYRWDGLEEDEEWMLEARTPLPKKQACRDALAAGHPYDNPLVEVLGPTQVPAPYASWAMESTR